MIATHSARLSAIALLLLGVVALAADAPPKKETARPPKRTVPAAGAAKPADAPDDADAAGANEAGAAEGEPEESVGNIRYRKPAGWEASEKNKMVVLNPPGETPSCSVILVSGEGLQDELLPWFKTRWAKLCKTAKMNQGGAPTVQQGNGGVSVVYQSALLEDDAGNTTGLLLYAAQVGDGVEWAVFQTVGPDLFNDHNKAVIDMLGGLRFVRTEAKPAPQKGKPAKRKE